MVQSYLKKVGHRTFTANKKGGNREFFPHFLAPFRISYCNDEELPRRDCNFDPWHQGAKLLFGRQFSVSDDADFILLQLKIGLQFQLSIVQLSIAPYSDGQSVSVLGDLPMISYCLKLLLIQYRFLHPVYD